VLEDRCLLANFLVASTQDSGPGSLRQAILDSNATAGVPDTISFAMPTTDPGYNPTAGTWTIRPVTELPIITDPLVLDATTQPGFDTANHRPVIELAGGTGGTSFIGLDVPAGNSTVRGLVINRFYVGIRLRGNGGDQIEGNYIGTDATGTVALANGFGIYVYGSDGDTIGGTAAGAGNLVSGNTGAGIGIYNSTGDVVQGNLVGTDATGTVALGNGDNGISVGFSSNILIGGTMAGARNVVSGNALAGVNIGLYMASGTATGNVLQGNYIGLDATGTRALGNQADGVVLNGAGVTDNTIGGTAAGAGNVISANRGDGVSCSTRSVIQGNRIGTDASGTVALGNSGGGVFTRSDAVDSTIGGTATGARNVISGNAGAGVLAAGDRSVVQGNYIGTDITGTRPVGNSGDGILMGARDLLISSNVIADNGTGGIRLNVGLGGRFEGNFIGTDATGTKALGNHGIGLRTEGVGFTNETIGGTAAGAGNVISGNSGDGILLYGSGHVVQGNRIGTDVTGTAPLPNGGSGVRVLGSGMTIGGLEAGAGNTIAFNAGDGVVVSQGTGNPILSNAIFSNAGLGIDGNYSQAVPVLTSVGAAGDSTTITGTLNSTSTPNATFTVQFFADAPAPFLRPQGRTFLGQEIVTTDGSGHAAFTAAVAALPAGQTAVTATATDLAGNTSEFSVGFKATLSMATSLSFSGLATSTTAGTSQTFTLTALDSSSHTASGYTGTVHFTSSDPQAKLPPDYTFTTGDSGVHAFHATLNTSGSQSLTVTDVATASIAASATIQVTATAALFAPQAVYSTGRKPYSVAVGDLNRDGIPDLVTANFDSNTISVLLGKGDGTFQPASDYSVGSNPVAVVVGDFNGDGKPDLAASNSGDGTVSLLLGKGDGTFAPAGTLKVGAYPGSLATGDFNHDGKLDLAVPNWTDGTVSVLLGKGNGSFQSAVSYNVGAEPRAVAVGDFNGDGKLDLAVARQISGTVAVLLGNGDGTFQPAVNYSAGYRATSVAAGDLNHDGKLDLVTANFGTDSASVLLGNGDGTFQPAENDPAGSNPHSVAVGDLNGDGNLDLAVANNGGNTVNVFLGIGDGTFQAPQTYAVGAGPFSVAVGDFNRDGAPDLAVANGIDSTVSILLGEQPSETLAVTGLPSSVTAGAAGTVTVSITDPQGNPDTGYAGTVHFASSDPRATLPADYTFTAADQGTHAFSATLVTAGSQSVTVTDTATASLTGTQSAIQVSPASASTLRLDSSASSVTAGATLSLTVTALDAYGNTATGYTGTVHFTSSDAKASLPGDYTFTGADQGVHAFANSVTLITAGTQTVTATSAGMTSGLTSWWPGEGNANDVVGGNNGTLVGGVTFAPGEVGQAFSLNGVDGYVNFGSAPAFDVQDFTLDAWVSVDPAQNTGERRVLSRDDSVLEPDSVRQMYALKSSSNAGGQGHARFEIMKGGVFTAVTAPAPLSAGFHHLAATRSGNTLSLYVDGLLVASATTTISGVISPNAPLVLGEVSPANKSEFFKGLVDEADLYSRALSPAEIQSIDSKGAAGKSGTISGNTSVTVIPASASTFVISSLPSAVTAGVPLNITVTALDSSGHSATGYLGTVHFTSSDGQASLPADYTFVAADQGTHTFNLTFNTSGSQSVTVTDTATPSISVTQAGISVQPAQAADHLVINAAADATARSAFSITVTALDASGNTATGYAGTIHFTSSDPQATLPADYTFTSSDLGKHSFDVTLTTVGNQTITAVDAATSTVTGSGSLTVHPAVASQFQASAPASTTAGSAFNINVAAVDSTGTTMPDYTGTVHFSSSDPAAVLPADYTYTAADQGVHTFSVIVKTSGIQAVTVTDTATAIAGTASGIRVNPLPAVSLRLGGLPVSSTAGTALNFTLTAVDAYGNADPTYTGTVHFASSDGGATLPADYTFSAADQGVHPFNATFRTVGSIALTATDLDVGTITGTQALNVNPAAAATLRLENLTPSAAAGSPQTFSVAILDSSGNVASGYRGTIHFSSTDPQAVLPGDYTFTSSDAGRHTFQVTLNSAGAQSVSVTDTAASSLSASRDVTVNALTPLTTDQQSWLLQVLQQLDQVGDKVAGLAALGASLPGIGQGFNTLFFPNGQGATIGDLVKLHDTAQAYFQGTTAPTTAGLIQALLDRALALVPGSATSGTAAAPVDVQGGFDASQQQLRFDVGIHLELAKSFTLDLGSKAAGLGLRMTAPPTLNMDLSLDLSFSFGLDLGNIPAGGSLTASDAFFQLNSLQARAQVHATTINFGLSIGFLGARVNGGSADLDAGVQVLLTDPGNGGDGKITLADLGSRSPGDLVTLKPTGTLRVVLPVSASIGDGFSTPTDPGQEPVITLTADAFDGTPPDLQLSNFDQLSSFNNITPDNLLGLIKQLGGALDQFRQSSVFAVPIPFAKNKTLGSVLDFAQAFTDKLTGALESSSGTADFGSAQDLARILATALGLDPTIITPNYDPASNELTFHVSFTDTLASVSVPIDLGGDTVGPVSGIGASLSGTVSLRVSVAFDFVFGIDLSPLGADQTLADHFFIDHASVTGTLNLEANDINALARLGPVGLGIKDGYADATGAVTLRLKNPNADTTSIGLAALGATAACAPDDWAGSMIPLSQLLDGVRQAPERMIASPLRLMVNPGAIVNISKKAGNQAESAIAVDPTDKDNKHLFVASMSYPGNMGLATTPGPLFVAFSDDGGYSWNDGAIPAAQDGTIHTAPADPPVDLGKEQEDPSAVYDEDGNLWLAFVDGFATTKPRILVLRAAKGSTDFSVVNTIYGATREGSVDQPRLAAGPGCVWLAYRWLSSTGWNIGIEGATVSSGSFTTDIRDIPANALLGDIAVGPQRQVYVTCYTEFHDERSHGSNILLLVDPDGSQELGLLEGPSRGFQPVLPPVPAPGKDTTSGVSAEMSTDSKEPELKGDQIPAQKTRGITPEPRLAIDYSQAHPGRLYLVYTDGEPGGALPTNKVKNTRIYVRFSDNGGGTWSPDPTLVNSDVPGVDHFLPSIAVDRKTGDVAVTWYDTRVDAGGTRTQFYGAVSIDGGSHFLPDFLISSSLKGSDDQPLSSVAGAYTNQFDYGDYTGLAFSNGILYPVWSDNSNSTLDNPQTNGGDGNPTFDVYTSQLAVCRTTTQGSQASSLGPVRSLSAAPASVHTATDNPLAGIFTGAAEAGLPLTVDAGFLGTSSGTPKITIDLPDITDLSTLKVTTTDLDSLLPFKDLSFSTIVDALDKAAHALDNYPQFGFLNSKLPLINKSVTDLLDFAGPLAHAVDQLGVNGLLNALKGEILQLLHLSPDSNALQLTYDAAGKALKVDVTLDTKFDKALGVNLDLAALTNLVADPNVKAFLQKLTQIADVSGQATVAVTADATLTLDVGINLDSTDSDNYLHPFLYDDTGVSLDAMARGSDLTFTANVAGLGIFVKGGSAVINKDGALATTDPATFALGVTNATNHRHYLDANLLSDLTVSATGGVGIDLPVYFPVETMPAGDLTITIPDLVALFKGTPGSVTITTPDFSSLIGQFTSLNNLLLTNPGALVNGFAGLLADVQDGLDRLGTNLPLVGNQLAGAAGFIGTFQNDVVKPLAAVVGDVNPINAVQHALFDVFGPGHLNLLADPAGNKPQPGSYSSVDQIINQYVPAVIEKDSAGQVVGLQFVAHLHDSFIVTIPLATNIGVPGLALTVVPGSQLQVKLTWDLNVGLGFSQQDGLYLDNSAEHLLAVKLDVTPQAINATGRLGFLQVNVTDTTTATSEGLHGDFYVNLVDPDANPRKRLTLATLVNGRFDVSNDVQVHLGAAADLHLHLQVSYKDAAQFPSIQTDFHLIWTFSPTDPGLSGGVPTIEFNDVRLDLGSFITNFAQPFLVKINNVIAPLQKVIDILDAPLLVTIDNKQVDLLGQLGFHNPNDPTKAASLLDMLVNLRIITKDVYDGATSFIDVYNLVHTLARAAVSGTSLQIDFGSFRLGAPDPSNRNPLTFSDDSYDARSPGDPSQTVPDGLPAIDLGGQLTNAGGSVPAEDQTFMSDLNTQNAGFSFPFISQPSILFGLLMGKNVDLVKFSSPTLTLGFSMHYDFPLPPLPVLVATVAGSIDASFHLQVGYDTYGLKELVEDPQHNWTDVLDGLYIYTDPSAPVDKTTEVSLKLTLGIGGGVNLGVASGGVMGQLSSTISVVPHDPHAADTNLKHEVRWKDMVNEVANDPLCLFDISGKVTASLLAWYDVIGSPQQDFDLFPPMTLLNFDVGCGGNTGPAPSGTTPAVASSYIPGTDVSIVAPNLQNVQAVANPDPSGSVPPGVNFAFGFVTFQETNLLPGATSTVVVSLPVKTYPLSGPQILPGEVPPPPELTYYKFGRTPDNPTPHWYNFAFDPTTNTGAVISTQDKEGFTIQPGTRFKDYYVNRYTRIILHFVDGQRGDDDLTANGVIVDPGAIAMIDTPSQSYVAQLYRDLLHREAEPAGLAFWSGLLDRKVQTPVQVAWDIETSLEGRTVQVQTAYGKILGRAADPRELSRAVASLRQGGTIEQLEANLIGSPEYLRTRGGGTRAGFEAALFHDVLGQPIDPRSRANFTRLLAGGMTRAELARVLMRSNRAEVVQAADLSRKFAHREADPASLKSYSRALARGVRDEVVVSRMEAFPGGPAQSFRKPGRLEHSHSVRPSHVRGHSTEQKQPVARKGPSGGSSPGVGRGHP
jgi:hypothetical protein